MKSDSTQLSKAYKTIRENGGPRTSGMYPKHTYPKDHPVYPGQTVDHWKEHNDRIRAAKAAKAAEAARQAQQKASMEKMSKQLAIGSGVALGGLALRNFLKKKKAKEEKEEDNEEIYKDMDNEFDKAASKILRENLDDISAERWGDEWDLDELHPDLKRDIELFKNNLGDMESASTIDLQDIVNDIATSSKYIHADKEQAIGYLEHIAKARLDKDELYGPEGIFSDIDDVLDLEFNKEENIRDLAKPIHSWMRDE